MGDFDLFRFRLLHICLFFFHVQISQWVGCAVQENHHFFFGVLVMTNLLYLVLNTYKNI